MLPVRRGELWVGAADMGKATASRPIERNQPELSRIRARCTVLKDGDRPEGNEQAHDPAEAGNAVPQKHVVLLNPRTMSLDDMVKAINAL